MEQSFLAYLGQFSYFFILLSYAFRSTTWLRLLAVAGSMTSIVYGFIGAGETLWIPILWNLLFLLVNGVHLTLAFWRSRAVALDALEVFASKTALANFPVAEVKSFLAMASESQVPEGQRFIADDSEIDYLYFIVHGTAHIFKKEKKLAELFAGGFVGEISLLTQSKTRADVVAGTDLNLLVWPHKAIEEWVDADASRLSLLQTALGRQVVEELLRQQGQGAA